MKTLNTRNCKRKRNRQITIRTKKQFKCKNICVVFKTTAVEEVTAEKVVECVGLYSEREKRYIFFKHSTFFLFIYSFQIYLLPYYRFVWFVKHRYCPCQGFPVHNTIDAYIVKTFCLRKLAWRRIQLIVPCFQ